MWLIALPNTTRIFLRELKQLALCEFIPFEWLKQGDMTEEIETELVVEEIGIDRFGSNSLVDGMGAFLVIGIAIGVVLLVLILMRLLAMASARVMKCFNLLRAKMEYGVLLRFVLQSALKLQIATCTVVAYERLTVKESYEPTTTFQLAIAITIIGFFNLCPFLFWHCLYRNRKNLGEPETMRKYGTLYIGLNADKPHVMSYSIVFLVRRSFFVAITFGLFEQPGI